MSSDGVNLGVGGHDVGCRLDGEDKCGGASDGGHVDETSVTSTWKSVARDVCAAVFAGVSVGHRAPRAKPYDNCAVSLDILSQTHSRARFNIV